ncbi:MAG: phytanoyl-CoA dioxygenase family protein, partial [Planctomycetota bacterium]
DLLQDSDRNDWDRDGILLVRGLLTPGEVQEIRDHFDDFVKTPKTIENHWYPVSDEEAGGDPLKRYPRVLQPHAFMELAKRYMLHERIGKVLAELLQDDPIATQSMYYFKPSGAKGQALHQDNYYLRVKPYTCVAAWCAIDPAMPENGGMSLVPGTKDYDIQCPRLGDATPDFVKQGSFTHDYVAPPEGTEAVPHVMQPGDVLFFNGSVIHGSTPNTHPTLWRRSFICHYMPSAAKEISGYYHTFGLWDFDGNRVDRAYSEEDGGPCGREDAAMTEGQKITV